MKAKQFSDFKSVTQKVKFLLKENPHLRDNDEALMLMYHRLELGSEIANFLTFDDYGAKVTNRRLTKFCTITRSKRRLMQLDESLRSENYKTKEKKTVPFFKINKRG